MTSSCLVVAYNEDAQKCAIGLIKKANSTNKQQRTQENDMHADALAGIDDRPSPAPVLAHH